MRIVLKPAGLLVVLLAIGALAVFAFTKAAPSTPPAPKTVASTTPAPAPTPANVATNADMSVKGANGLPEGWGDTWSGRGKISIAQDMTEGNKAAPSLRIDTNASDGQGQVTQRIPVQPGEKIVVTGSVKSEGTGTFSFAAQFYDDKLTPLGFEHIVMPKPGEGWQHGEKTLTIPERATTVGIVAYADGTGKGWVDDVSVTRER